MDPGAAVILAAITVVVVVYLARHHNRVARARFLRRVGFGISVTCLGFFAVFLAGETMADPGGWLGVALVLSWAAPLTAGVLLAWYRPAVAGPVFAALTGAIVVLNVWFAADPAGWRSLENRHGPVRAVAIFVLAAGLAVHGVQRTQTAGVLLLVLGFTAIAASSVRAGGFSSLVAAASVPTITGGLYLASSVLQHHGRTTPRQHARTRSRPRAV